MSTLKSLVIVCLIGCCLAAPKPVDWDQVGRKIKNFGNQVRDKVNEVKEKVLPVAQSACEYINTIPQVPRFQKQINFPSINRGFPRNPSFSFTPRFPPSNSLYPNRFSSSLNPSTRVFNTGFIPRRPTPEISRFYPSTNGYNPGSFLGAGRAPTTERVFSNLNPNWSRFYPFTTTERVFTNLNHNRSRFYPFTTTERVFTNLNLNPSRFYPSNNNPGSFLGAGRAPTTESVGPNLNVKPSTFRPFNNPGPVLGAGAAPTTEKVATSSSFKPSSVTHSNNVSNEVPRSGFDLSNVTPNGFKGASSTPGFTFEQKDLNDGEIPPFPRDEDEGDIDSSIEEINDKGIDNSGHILSESSKLVSRYAY